MRGHLLKKHISFRSGFAYENNNNRKIKIQKKFARKQCWSSYDHNSVLLRGHLLINTIRFTSVFHMKTTITENSKTTKILPKNGVGAVMTIIVFL